MIEEVPNLPVAVLDALPNPVLVKDAETRYIWVNQAFERLFNVRSEDLVGRLDSDLFQQRQAAQCNGGDLRVLASGEVDEAEETVIDPELGARETLTRKSRLVVGERSYLVGVMHDVTDVLQANQKLLDTGQVLKEQAQALQQMANTDYLTGCLNRRAIFAAAEFLAEPSSGTAGLIVMDLDRFKTINDQYGHGGGDAVLQSFVATVSSQLRPADVLARLGGEEFAVLLPEVTTELTNDIAERIRVRAATDLVNFEGATIDYTVSIGVAHHAGTHTTRFGELMSRADRCLYQAKAQGRNQVVVDH